MHRCRSSACWGQGGGIRGEAAGRCQNGLLLQNCMLEPPPAPLAPFRPLPGYCTSGTTTRPSSSYTRCGYGWMFDLTPDPYPQAIALFTLQSDMGDGGRGPSTPRTFRVTYEDSAIPPQVTPLPYRSYNTISVLQPSHFHPCFLTGHVPLSCLPNLRLLPSKSPPHPRWVTSPFQVLSQLEVAADLLIGKFPNTRLVEDGHI